MDELKSKIPFISQRFGPVRGPFVKSFMASFSISVLVCLLVADIPVQWYLGVPFVYYKNIPL